VPADLLSNKYGHRLHFWNLRERRNVQTIDLGANHQMPLEVASSMDSGHQKSPMHSYAWYVWRKSPRSGPSLKVRVGRLETIATPAT
jgi:hypothetical protein